MTTPLVAVTADNKFVEPYNWHATPSPYIDAAIAAAKALPVIVPSVGDKLDIDTLLDRVDGVLVTGSRSNVHPSHYGEEPTEDHEPFDPDRDATTLPLIRRAIERGVPLLAICRGIQELNVALGGSITAAFQKNRAIEGHGYPWEGTLDERFSLAHEVRVEAGSCLADILQSDVAKVNSLHTQALERVGENIIIEARAEDGTIEAVSVSGARGFVVGVQWHPEYWAQTDTASNKILHAFGEAARAHLTAKSSAAIAAE
ncbi:gamma-glutamyl-gamma-aminobutyrate hydrolase family protein [Pseudahrensia aquimaris]|uniref:Gamma-glutamyl-gamma-aminobutyrate hydrolase family protein n=1 Tax=Pseudahrensia aquimaris TaxID=744461 RepID=A0ABW3FG14_9HYPH